MSTVESGKAFYTKFRPITSGGLRGSEEPPMLGAWLLIDLTFINYIASYKYTCSGKGSFISLVDRHSRIDNTG